MIDIAAVGGAQWSGHAAMIATGDTVETGPDPFSVRNWGRSGSWHLFRAFALATPTAIS
jgi:hypothetical protein